MIPPVHGEDEEEKKTNELYGMILSYAFYVFTSKHIHIYNEALNSQCLTFNMITME